jgi:acyl-CoA synthetase (AMP-forming)/AMP-acid ligase II
MDLRDKATPLLHDFLIASAQRLPSKIALVCQGKRLTYEEIDKKSNALAHALGRAGVKRGDRVVVFADNTVEAVISFWGVLKANAIVSMVNPQTKEDKLTYLLNDCRAKVLITDGHLTPTFATAASKSSHLVGVIISGGIDKAKVAGLPGVLAWEDALGAGPGNEAPKRESIDIDLAGIVYTSGSTGDPKGVMLTHRNMLTAATSITTSSSACCRWRSTTAFTK